MSPVRYVESNGLKVLCLFTNAFSQGGIQRFNRCLIKALCELMPDPVRRLTILSLADQPDKFDSFYLCKLARYSAFSGNRFKFVTNYLKETGYDLVIIGHIKFLPLALLSSAKTFLVIHGVEAWKRLDTIKRISLYRIDKILSVSNFTKDQLKKYNRVADKKFFIFPNTLDPAFQDIKPESLKLPSGKLLLTVSRLSSEDLYKGIDHTIIAMKDILDKVPDAYYVIVGDGDDRPRLEQLAQANGVRDRVIFTGFLRDAQLKYVYDKCDAFILPSSGEGFGITALEAFAMKKPAIAAGAGALPEIVDRSSGILVPYGQTKQIADAAITLLKDEKMRLSLGKAGYKLLMEKYTFDRFKSRLLTLLKGGSAGPT